MEAEEEQEMCNFHEETKDGAFCLTCEKALCRKCFLRHLEQEHKIRNQEEFVAQCKATYKESIDKFIVQHTGQFSFVNKFESEWKTTSAKLREDLKIEAENFVKNLIHPLDNNLSTIFNEISETKNKISEGMQFTRSLEGTEIGEMFDVINKFFPQNIYLLKVLPKKIKSIQDMMKKHIFNSKNSTEFLSSYNNLSSKLNSYRETELNAISQIEDTIFTKKQEMNELTRSMEWLQNECVTLQEEKAVKKKKSIEYNEIYQKLENQYKEILPELKKSQDILNNLNEEIRSKADLLVRLNQDVSERNFVIASLNKMLLDDVVKVEARKTGKVLTSAEEEAKTLANFALLESQLLYKLEADQNYLRCYNINTFSSHYTITHLSGMGAAVQIGNTLFFSGGFNKTTMAFEKSSYRADLYNMETLMEYQMSDMMVARGQHTLVGINSILLFAIGGKNKDKKFLNLCEKYLLLEDKWENGPSLNDGRIYCSALALNCRDLYVFGGFNNSSMMSIELLKDNATKWIKLKLKEGSKIWMGREQCGTMQISEDKILVFGGNHYKLGALDDVLVFCPSKLSFTRFSIPKMATKDWFIINTTVSYHNQMYIVGSLSNKIHKFTVNPPAWSIMNEKDLVKSVQEFFRKMHFIFVKKRFNHQGGYYGQFKIKTRQKIN